MKKIALFVFLMFSCMMLTLPSAGMGFDIQSLAAGIVITMLAAVLFGQYFISTPGKLLDIKRWFWFLRYIPVFFYHMLLANLDVMYRVLHPDLPINPGIVKVKTKLKSKSGRAALCNAITLTPGTLSLDISDEFIYIHWINVKSSDIESATKAIVDKFEPMLERIFE